MGSPAILRENLAFFGSENGLKGRVFHPESIRYVGENWPFFVRHKAIWRTFAFGGRENCQTVCKPGSVPPKAEASRGDGHSSGTPVAERLARPTRAAARKPACGPKPDVPPLFGLAPGGVCPATTVTGSAVRSYRTLSPLPFCAPGMASCIEGRFAFCGTFPGVAPAGCYPAPCFRGARTFLPSQVSHMRKAAIRPSGPMNVAVSRTTVKQMRCSPCQWSRFQGVPRSGPPVSITTTGCYRSAFVKTICFNDRETQTGSIDPRRPRPPGGHHTDSTERGGLIARRSLQGPHGNPSGPRQPGRHLRSDGAIA